ncbi:MAG: hypothetical protein ACI9GH_000527 [Candidatus Paceibacteria bacterium]|jgi:hypothetical protein
MVWYTIGMSFTKQYKEYAKDNPRGYWFKRKIYGWGWTPVMWQGWAVTTVYIAIIISTAFKLENEAISDETSLRLMISILVLTLVFIRVLYIKGESPGWQWGFPKKEK